jgi:hypothetical protein
MASSRRLCDLQHIDLASIFTIQCAPQPTPQKQTPQASMSGLISWNGFWSNYVSMNIKSMDDRITPRIRSRRHRSEYQSNALCMVVAVE